MDIIMAAKSAKGASINLAAMESEIKNKALESIANALLDNKDEIIAANLEDLKRSEENNLAMPLLKRLKFDESKIKGVAQGIKSLIELEEPVGEVLMETELDEGLNLFRESCPIGVIGVIFESRPDALVQISTLCLKSGNAVLLKGGSEAKLTNKVLAKIIADASYEAGIPKGWVCNLETREDVANMLKMDEQIDLIIPRGSNEFVRYIMDNSRIPVLGHADGICHCYVHSDADIDKAIKIINDSKTQYVAVCNALETLLVNENVADKLLPLLKRKLDESNVRIYGCENTKKIIDCEEADESAWETEYLDYELSIKIVESLDEAINHINKYGSGHTDVIVTENDKIANIFMRLVDSGNVFYNCSSRFSDGYRYGFGAEVGISTNKIHARGPVGLEGLLIYKYKLYGNGHIVKDYSEGKKTFTHRRIK